MAVLLENMLTFRDMAAHSHIPICTYKYWYHRNIDGFKERCGVQIRSKLYLDKGAVEAWLEEHAHRVRATAALAHPGTARREG